MDLVTLHEYHYGGEYNFRADTIVKVSPAKYAHWGTYVKVSSGETYNVRESVEDVKKQMERGDRRAFNSYEALHLGVMAIYENKDIPSKRVTEMFRNLKEDLENCLELIEDGERDEQEKP